VLLNSPTAADHPRPLDCCDDPPVLEMVVFLAVLSMLDEDAGVSAFADPNASVGDGEAGGDGEYC